MTYGWLAWLFYDEEEEVAACEKSVRAKYLVLKQIKDYSIRLKPVQTPPIEIPVYRRRQSTPHPRRLIRKKR